MNKYIVFIAILLGITCGIITECLNKEKAENQLLRANQITILEQYDALMAESQQYRVSDSLNAASVAALTLSLEEYKKYYANNYKAIKELKHAKSELQTVIDTQAETIIQLQTEVRQDTVSAKVDTLKCFTYESTWTSADGCFNLSDNTIDMQIKNRESLKIVETVTYRRFLGFLWKTNKVKSRQVDILSENPATQIINASYINIAK